MSELKKGDRVSVSIPPHPEFTGLIVGEGRKGLWWNIMKDGSQIPIDINKSFCRPEDISPRTDVKDKGAK